MGVETGRSVSAVVNGEAPLFDHRDQGCVPVVPVVGGLQRRIVETLILWTTSPVLRSPQTAISYEPSRRAAVNQKWSPETTGEDQPSSWIAVFSAAILRLTKLGRQLGVNGLPSTIGASELGLRCSMLPGIIGMTSHLWALL